MDPYIPGDPFHTSNCAPDSDAFFLERLCLLSLQAQKRLKMGAKTGNRTRHFSSIRRNHAN